MGWEPGVSGGGSADCTGTWAGRDAAPQASGPVIATLPRAHMRRWAVRSATLRPITLQVARRCVEARTSYLACLPIGGTSAKVAPMRIARLPRRQPLKETSVHPSQRSWTGGVRAAPPIYIAEIRAVVMQLGRRQENLRECLPTARCQLGRPR